MEQHRVAFIGDIQSTLPFTSVGIDIFPVRTDDEALSTFAEIVKKGIYAVIFITENLDRVLDDEINKIEYEALPSIILLPQITGSKGLGLRFLRDTMKKAAGRDIMDEEESGK
ncbi:V-type ATP synthase subunit F [bacterium]|nr:V-type ATP synthase subunit F [bacterium]